MFLLVNTNRKMTMNAAKPIPLKSFRPRMSGFTLTEILVVIAIVGVLATLMFPLVRRGMEKAKASQCVSNLRNCGVRFSTYLFDGKILQYEYVEGQYESNWKSVMLSKDEGNTLELSKITYCPAWNPSFAEYEGKPNNWFAYGMDVGALKHTIDPATNKFTVGNPVATMAIEQPSKYILLADSVARNKGAWTYNGKDKTKNYQVAQISISGETGSWDSEGCLHLRHDGRANVLFLDGHVQAMVPKEIRNMLNGYNQSTTPFYYWDKELNDKVQR